VWGTLNDTQNEERRVIKKMKTKMAAVFATLIIALMAVGVAYAMWDKYLYINGTVYTGEVDAHFTDAWCDDTGIDPGYDKDVAWQVIDGILTQDLIVTIYNGYPSYTLNVYYLIDNIGTIPVKIQTITLTNPNPAAITVTVTGIAVGNQIDPLGSLQGDLHIHIEQAADELETYTFGLEIRLVQWNEFT
jgi:hypothetical protein